MKTAILQCADTGPLESLVVMLRSIGYQCCTPDAKLKSMLRDLGCDTVIDIEHLVKHWGYEQPMPLPEAGLADMFRSDVLYVDVKAHRNGPLIWRKWPSLKERTLWYRVNGGKPEHVIRAGGMDCGDEINPPCPVLTPNQWYSNQSLHSDVVCSRCNGTGSEPREELCQNCDHCWGWCKEPHPWRDFVSANKAYTCWPPFHRFDDYRRRPIPTVEEFLDAQHVKTEGSVATMRPTISWGPPVCFIHNLQGWGYGKLASSFSGKLGINLCGNGSPQGLIPHSLVPNVLYNALAYVHLKSSDAPGYALYEALAAACPVVCTRRLIWRCRMQDLFIPNETCLVFDRETHEGLTDQDVLDCTKEVKEHLERLKDPQENRRIGQAGRERLKEIMWSDKNEQDVFSLRQFMTRNFPTLEGA